MNKRQRKKITKKQVREARTLGQAREMGIGGQAAKHATPNPRDEELRKIGYDDAVAGKEARSFATMYDIGYKEGLKSKKEKPMSKYDFFKENKTNKEPAMAALQNVLKWSSDAATSPDAKSFKGAGFTDEASEQLGSYFPDDDPTDYEGTGGILKLQNMIGGDPEYPRPINKEFVQIAIDGFQPPSTMPSWRYTENKMNIKKIIKEELQNFLTETEASKCKQMLDNGEISPDQYKACVDQYEKDYGEVEDTGARPIGEGKVADAFTHAAATDQPLTKWVPLLKKIAAHPEFQAIAAAGKTDAGGPKDEAFVVKPETATASKLQAMQKEIGFNKSLKDQVTNPKWKPVDAALGLKGTPIEMPCQDTRCAILTFAGKYILDGHHRWSQIMMMNPDAQVAIDDLQPTGVLKNPEDALKVMQLAIALKADKVVTEPFDGADLMASTPEEVAQFVMKNIKDEVLQLMVQAEKIPKPDKELAAKYIAANLPAIQKLKGKFVRGEVMPQAGKSGTSQDAVNQALATGAVNFIKPRPEDVKKKLGEAKKQLRKIIREELRAVVS